MKKKSRLIIVFFVIAVMVMQPILVCAGTQDFHSKDSFNKTQNEYINSIKFETTEDGAIETCELYIRLFRAYSRGGDYCPEVLVTKDNMTNNLLYRKSEADYKRTLSERQGFKIVSDSVELTPTKVILSGKEAIIDIYEKYEYELEEFSDEVFFRSRLYTFELIMNKGKWLIKNITTDDLWEKSANFTYCPIDVEKQMESLELERLNNGMSNTTENLLNKSEAASSSLYKWTYYPNIAVMYAEDYLQTVNPLFGSNNANCQNFASQCVWAGLRGSYSTATATTTYPSVISAIVGRNSKNVWARNDYSNYYSQSYFNWAWDNAAGFAKLIKMSTTTTYGPFGNTHYGTLDYAHKGSVISINWDGNATETTMDHAMVVTKIKSGATVGSINRGDLYVAANSSTTNTAYEPLLNYCGSYPEANYATCIISCGYYPQAQYNN